MRMTPASALLILSFCAAISAARLTIQPFGPTPPTRLFTTNPTTQSSFLSASNPRQAAIAFAKQQYNLKEGEFVVKNAYKTDHLGVTHVYLRQIVRGEEVANADMNVNVDDDGKVISYGSSFVKVTPEVLSKSKTWGSPDSTGKFVDAATAFKTLAKHLQQPAADVKAVPKNSLVATRPKFELSGVPYAQENVKAEPSYIINESGLLVPTWKLNLRMSENWFDAHVQADGSKVVLLHDWVADATYNVLKLGDVDPVSQQRALVKDPAHATASSKGWHDQGNGKTFTTTIGNNVFAQENWAGGSDYLNNKRPDGGKDLVFNNALNLTQDAKPNIDAATTNLFYWNNIMHDVFYMYGFNEEGGNFQETNFGGKGAGSDAVIANAQDGSGTNNANFATPPDGQHGRMRMYKFTVTKPERDGDLETDIIAHEYTHGISNRLTGGPSNTGCLPWGESGGMGEGWSDFTAVTLQLKGTDAPTKDIGVGAWVLNGKTIRKYMYSTNNATNPTTYGYITSHGMSEVHATGEIWTNILYQLYWNLVADTKKYNTNWYSADLTSGNTLTLQLVIDGMKLQPCNPTFVTARDAILQADQKATNGSHKCAIWKAFARRGVGAKATGPSAEDFSVPEGCPKVEETTEWQQPQIVGDAPAIGAPSKFNPKA